MPTNLDFQQGILSKVTANKKINEEYANLVCGLVGDSHRFEMLVMSVLSWCWFSDNNYYKTLFGLSKSNISLTVLENVKVN